MLPSRAMPLIQDQPASYGTMPLMNELMDMQHHQFMDQGIFNEFGVGSVGFLDQGNAIANMVDQNYPSKIMSDSTNIDNGPQIHRGLDTLKFIDEHANINESAAVQDEPHPQYIASNIPVNHSQDQFQAVNNAA